MHQTETSTSLAALLEEGERALRAGDTIEARNFFRQITETDPQHAAAWLGIARSVRPYHEKRNLLLRVLEIEPDNQTAQTMLAEVEARLEAGELLAPRILPPKPEGDSEAAPAAPEAAYCYRHPDRETLLRCIQCENPICVECVRPAAVGQLCPDCAQQRRPRNYQVTPKDTLITAIAAIGAGFLATLGMLLFVLNIPFFGIIIAFIAAPAYAELFVRVLDRLTRAKRGQNMQIAASVGLVLGLSPTLLVGVLAGGFTLLIVAIFTVLCISTVVARLR